MRTFAFIVVMIVGIQAYENVIYPTDCPPGKNCYEEVVKNSTNLLDLVKNFRQKFPWAEVEVMFDEKAEVPEQLRCDRCVPPSTEEVQFKPQERDSHNCTIIHDATCKGSKTRLSQYADGKTTKLLTCRQDQKWEYIGKIGTIETKVVVMDDKWCQT